MAMSKGHAQYNDVARTDPQTLVRWFTDQQRIATPNAEGDLSILLGCISVACKFVASAVRKVCSGSSSAPSQSMGPPDL